MIIRFPNESLLATGRFFHPTIKSRLVFGPPKSRQAIFLDRDGVLIADEGYLLDPTKIKFLPGVTEALTKLRTDYYLIVITNQSCISRGLLSENGLRRIHGELCKQLAMNGIHLDGIYFCPHHPLEGNGLYQIECRCRKPQPGMLLQARADWSIDMDRSFMVGDNHTDAEAARLAGVEALMVGTPNKNTPESVVSVPDLLAAAHHIMSKTNSAMSDTSGEIN